MDPEDKHKDLNRLARVRENQRKSRARKQEYVRELEQQLAVHREQTQQKDIEHRLAIQRLEAENQNLKTLLGSLGVSADLIHQYVTLAGQGTVMDHKVAIPATPRPKKEATSMLSCDKVVSRPPSPPGDKSLPRAGGLNSVSLQLPSRAIGYVLNTTLCAIAEDLIAQCNARGTDIEELRQRLCSGFSKGQGDGCRVQNNILFQILDEISN
ncbi:hypothetical protein N7513_011064 [Penicillium frequentans]|nr:hypothetical protein N7513_011064 [Penicillium glabrum]